MFYYCKYLKEIHGVLQQLDSSTEVSSKEAKLLFSENFLKPNLVFIH